MGLSTVRTSLGAKPGAQTSGAVCVGRALGRVGTVHGLCLGRGRGRGGRAKRVAAGRPRRAWASPSSGRSVRSARGSRDSGPAQAHSRGQRLRRTRLLSANPHCACSMNSLTLVHGAPTWPPEKPPWDTRAAPLCAGWLSRAAQSKGVCSRGCTGAAALRAPRVKQGRATRTDHHPFQPTMGVPATAQPPLLPMRGKEFQGS